MSRDAIVKSVVLKAPRARVWRAVGDADAFGVWFGMTFEGPFVAGATVRGRIAPTRVDAEIAKLQAPYAGVVCDLYVERVEPERCLAFRWHPGASPRSAGEPTTLVTFELEDAPGGTRLTITESGFDAIPLERRAKAFADNEGGWAMQTTLIAKYLDVA